MEISLDNMQVSFMTAGIKTASDSVSLTAAETEIKSRSEAMDKFQEEYRQLKAFVKDYRDTLNNDLGVSDDSGSLDQLFPVGIRQISCTQCLRIYL